VVRIELSLRIVAAGAAFLACMGEGAMSQAPTQTGQALPNDIAVTLKSGTVVRIRNIAIFRGQTSSELVVYIETPTPSTETARLALEAKELAGLQVKGPMTGNLTSVSVAVCRTTTCLQMKEKPEELFVFVRNADGSLEAEKRATMTRTGDDGPLMRIANFLVGEWQEPECGSQPAEGERVWFTGGDYCEWVTPARGQIVAQRDQHQRVHAVIMNRQANSEANAHAILDSLATALRSLGLRERECEPGSSPAGAIRSWLYEDRKVILVHISEITPQTGPPRLMGLAVDSVDAFPRAMCQ
jgi:hypothetical protein